MNHDDRLNMWGTRIVRSSGQIPFKQYQPRPGSLLDILDASVRYAGRDALAHEDRRMSYADLPDAVAKAAARLADDGVRRGDLVMLFGLNSPDWVIGFWAILRCGAVAVLGNGWWSSEEIDVTVRAMDPRLILVDERLEPRMSHRSPRLRIEGLGTDRVGPAPLDDAAVTESATAVILFTSGTSGFPKGAVLSHRSLVALVHSLLDVTKRIPRADRLPPVEATLQTAPLFHIGGIQALLLATALGQTMVLLSGRFEPRKVLDMIEREQITRWGGVATMASRVVNDPSIEGRNLTSLRSLTLGGSPVPPEVAAQLGEVFPNLRRGFSQIYGMSEAGGTLTAASARDSLERPGTVGRILPLVDLRIHEPDANGIGEILARTPTQMTGYWRDVEPGVLDADGWLHTGDLGYIDEGGYLFVTGRTKDVIIRGGENIAPAHVESAILTHPEIVEAAVVGLPDEDLGETVAAAIRVRDGGRVTETELVDYLRTRLAYFEVPRRWWFHDRGLPLQAAGKVDKLQLKQGWPATGERSGDGRS